MYQKLINVPEADFKKSFHASINNCLLLLQFSSRVNEGLKNSKLVGTLRDEFTRDIVSAIKVHTIYPTAEEKQKVASMVIQKYPFLADSIGAGPVSYFCALYDLCNI